MSTAFNQTNQTLAVNDLVLTQPRQPIADLDALPLLDRSLINYKKYSRYLNQADVSNCLSIQATRGCPYGCAYCHKLWPKKHFFRSCENIFQEIKIYYDMGIRRFSFVDDIFNLNRENSAGLFNLIIKNRLDIQLFFHNGLRADIMTRDYIDLMIEAGTKALAFALETASPRLQKLIHKNVNLDQFRENLEYLLAAYPQVITELFTMHGFPTETEEEAMMTLDFIKKLKGLHFVYINILKIYPNTDMEKLALENGISKEKIRESLHYAYHELPETLPFSKNFTIQYQSDYLNNYFLKKERLLPSLSYQRKVLTEDEHLRKYNNYLSTRHKCFDDLLEFLGINKSEFDPGNGPDNKMDKKTIEVPEFDEKLKSFFAPLSTLPRGNALRILLLDLSHFFSDQKDRLHNRVEQPLGLMSLLSYLKRELGDSVLGKIAKSFIDFDSYPELKGLLEEFYPDVIGIRTLTYYKGFFHETLKHIRDWGFNIPIITGGPYATGSYSSIFRDGNIDCLVKGEGEITFARLISEIIKNNKKLPGEDVLKTIPGIAFLKQKNLQPARKQLQENETGEFRF